MVLVIGPASVRNRGEMASSKVKKAKATWTTAFHKIFVDICLEQTLQGHKTGTCFTKVGWKNMVESFHRKSGVRYESRQLKNHWGVTKEQRKVWLKLIGTGSMRWDSNTQRFGASEEDWANYIQVTKQSNFKTFSLLESIWIFVSCNSHAHQVLEVRYS